MRIIFLFILFQIVSSNAYAAVTFFKESCGDNYIKSISQIYFETSKPQELFSLIGSNIGTYNAKTGVWISDPSSDLKIKTFLSKHRRTKTEIHALTSAWENENISFISSSFGKGSKVSTCMLYLQIHGVITAEDLISINQKIAEFENPPFLHVSLNSTGGNVEAAIGIGKVIRAHYGVTDVSKSYELKQKLRPGGGCLSACVLIYASGIAKNIGLDDLGNGNGYPIGIHQHYLSEDNIKVMSVEKGIELLRKTKRLISNYFDEIGVSQELLNLSLSIPSDKIRVLTDAELKLYLPYAVAEYAVVLPIKINQARTAAINLYAQGMSLSFDKLGPNKQLKDYLVEYQKIVSENMELFKWAAGPEYYIKSGLHSQNWGS